jgi:chloramphenicol-sensitive protein RarD
MNRGIALAIASYLVWGFAALYWLQTRPVSAVDLIAHRVVWSLPVLLLFLLFMGRLRSGLRRIAEPRTMMIMLASALAQAVNWGLFLWAVTHERATEASLGYFLLPLANVGIGVFLFRETIDRAQKIAVVLAATGVVIMVADSGGVPWIALGLALSFGLYGAIHKSVSVEAVEGLLLEILWLFPAALIWLWLHNGAGLGSWGSRVDGFLVASGVITVVPLVCYVAASRMLPLSSLGLVFYLGPTCQLFVAICLLGEPMNPVQISSFALVWVGLAFIIADTLRRYRSVRALQRE